MRLPERFKPDTFVSCNVRGRMFRARVVERVPSGVRIEPPAGITYHVVTARQITAIHTNGFDPRASQWRGAA